jgi:hypothetical protein
MLAYLRVMKQEAGTMGCCLDEAKRIYLQAMTRHQTRDSFNFLRVPARQSSTLNNLPNPAVLAFDPRQLFLSTPDPGADRGTPKN